MKIHRLEQSKIDEIIRLYEKDGYRKADISKITGISRPTIDDILNGIKPEKNYYINKGTDEKIIDMYSKRISIEKITKEVHKEPSKIYATLKFHNIVPDKGRRWRKMYSGIGNKEFYIKAIEFMKLIDKQNNKCAICGKDFEYSRANLDHEHGTENIRGILCGRCNIGLAWIEDVEYLEKAKQYLSNYNFHPKA